MKFAEIIEGLEQGKQYRRREWSDPDECVRVSCDGFLQRRRPGERWTDQNLGFVSIKADDWEEYDPTEYVSFEDALAGMRKGKVYGRKAWRTQRLRMSENRYGFQASSSQGWLTMMELSTEVIVAQDWYEVG